MEPIHWHKPTPAQRDAEIHEKVMGYVRKTVRHEVPSRAGGIAFIANVTSWQTGGPDAPPYTASMDAAWLVLQNMVERYGQEPLDQFFDFAGYMFDVSGWDRTEIHGDVYPGFQVCIMAAKWTPEAICIAALRALGYEVLTEE